MTKKDFKDLLGKKAPNELRKGIQQIDILREATEVLSLSESGADESDGQNHSGKKIEETDEQSSSTKNVDRPDEEKRRGKPPIKVLGENSSAESSTKPIKSIDEKKRSAKSAEKTERRNRSTSRRKSKVFSSRDVQAILEIDKRATERYSFEIYSDQKEDIQQICDLYEKATGKKLSASRLIREVLDTFLPDALKTFEVFSKENTEE